MVCKPARHHRLHVPHGACTRLSQRDLSRAPAAGQAASSSQRRRLALYAIPTAGPSRAPVAPLCDARQPPPAPPPARTRPPPPSRASSPLLLAPERAPGQLGRTWRHPVTSPPAAHAPWPPSRAATVAADASPARTRGAQGAPQRGAHALVKGRKKVRGRCMYTFVNHTRNPPTLRAVALAPRQARGACTGRATARPHPDLAGRRGAAGACACAWRTAPDFVRAFVCGRTGCCGPRDSRGGRAQAPRPQPWSSSSGARSWVRASRAVRCPRLSGA